MTAAQEPCAADFFHESDVAPSTMRRRATGRRTPRRTATRLVRIHDDDALTHFSPSVRRAGDAV
jgi:hypothetical protein